jgi:hypothetical protein
MTIPLDASGLNFRAGPGLGRAARAFYSVKQLKTAFRTGLGPKKFTGFKIPAHARPVRFVGGPGAGRARVGPVGRVGVYWAGWTSCCTKATCWVAARFVMKRRPRSPPTTRAGDHHAAVLPFVRTVHC